tara:strand:- start:175 stop:492 length:318 start_codon:yes stop_codon:yes gene_type:complete
MKNILLFSFLLISILSYGQRERTLDLNATEKQNIVDELDNLRKDFYSLIESKHSEEKGKSKNEELKGVYVNFKKEWKNKLNTMSQRYALDPKEIVSIYAKLKKNK